MKCPKCGNGPVGESDTSVICELCGIMPKPNSCPKCGETEHSCGFCLLANVPIEIEPCVSCIDNPEHPNWVCNCGHEEKVKPETVENPDEGP